MYLPGFEGFNSDVVPSYTDMELTITVENPIPSGSIIEMTFPPEINIADAASNYIT